MKRLIYLCTMAAIAALSIAAVVQTDSPSLRGSTTELEQLHAALQAAKDAGQPADPAMLARARELEALVQPNVVTAPPQASPAPVSKSPEQAAHGIANQVDPSQVPSVAPVNPLESEIQRLEKEAKLAMASTSAQMTDLQVPAELKSQLNELYAQRPENQLQDRHSLDQGNDICTGTLITGVPYTDTGTTAGYANNYGPITPCAFTSAPDVVYYLVAPYTGTYTVSLCGSSYDTYLYVVDGDCGFTQLACNDDFCGLQSQVSFNATGGLGYTIFVDGYSTNSGAYVISVTGDCQAPITCQSGDVIEVAENPADPNFSTNDPDGGCNNTVPAFQNISCGQTVCGVGFTYLGDTYRDTDWYAFTLAQECSVRVTVTAEFMPHVLILGGGCPYGTIYANETGLPCTPLTVSSGVCLPPGNYTMFVAPAFGYAAPTPREYRATLECIPCHCVACQQGDIIECAETPGPNHISTDCSGGSCNTYYGGVASYIPIQCGQTYCAQTFSYNDHYNRDTDWYEFTLTQPASVTVTVEADNFIPTLSGFTQAGECSFMEQFIVGNACTPTTMSSNGCLPPGTYYVLVVGTFDMPAPATYRLNLSCTPCCYDQVLTAPGSVSGTTCAAGNDCNFRGSPDRVVRVNIPYSAAWTFSLCGLDNIWDSYMYLSDGCCGSVLEYSDDECGSFGLSRINCYYLPAGTYYIVIEGFSNNDCGPYTLNVDECIGRCCYGDPANPSCTVTNPITCSQLGGQYFEGETCDNGCYVRPDCFANPRFSQQPLLPGEGWNGFGSDSAAFGSEWADDFTGVTGPIGAIRFWGVPAGSGGPCLEDPVRFNVRFYANAGGLPGALVNSYVATLNGTPTFVYPDLGPAYLPREYQMSLTPACNLSGGWVSVQEADPTSPTCAFYWLTSGQGNGASALSLNSGPWGAQPSIDFSFCLGAPCQDPDSVVIKVLNPVANRIYFKALVTGLHKLYWSTAMNDITPNALHGQAYLTPGWWMVNVSTLPSAYARYVISVDCAVDTAPPVLENGQEPPLQFVPVSADEVMRQ